MRSARPIAARFAESYTPEPNTGCWLWLGALNSSGYGFMGGPRSFGTRSAHRVSYELFKGSVPEGFTIDHLCRVRSCVNPAHLEAVTHSVNVKRGRLPEINRARAAVRKCCSRGHAYTDENTLRSARGSRQRRQCRTCVLANQRLNYARRKAQHA